MFHGPAFSADPKPLKVGVRGGVDEQIWEVVAQVAKKNGLAVEPVVITGTASPNEALNNGDLEANAFQHIPFLNDQIKQRGYKLVPVANTLISPIAFYSKKYKSLKDLPDGAKVGIPNDPSNQTRALVILRDQGLITLKDGFDPATGTATLADVTSNPKKLDFVESASVVLARSLPDVDAAAIVNSFAYQAGLIATRDGIAVEKKENNPYVNIIVVREKDKDAPWVPELVKAYHSEAVRQFILTKFEGSVIPVF
ncbi:MetQ/NlpA family lipoprotein [Achromobacter sp. JD417]|uniref:MetQ/NlpA family ABC transporter substrate-binding protein n=1 Tax=Achromobacter sp. JD417 TaxID=2893881 RepID=UPI0035A5BB69